MAIDEEKEALFAEIALERGLVSEDELLNCERKKNELRLEQEEIRLGEVMMRLKLITKDQALDTLKEAHLRAGQKPRIGGYELEKKLGSGAMGAVYLARQVSMDRLVALKLLPRRLSQDPEYINRFMREARLCARLNHPNIIRAIDVGESNGYHFFAMEYVDGPNLRDLLDEKEVYEEREAIALLVQVLMGLEHAASHGIIHRDIKPSNIMVCTDGTAKIADMGLATKTGGGSSAHLTAAGVTVGTPYYMAPEQVEGKPNLDFRADIYALGATFFEVVVGRPPFEGNNVPAIMAKRLYEDPPVACDVNDTVSKGLSAVLYKMMEREPEKRFQEFSSLVADLHAVADGKDPECKNVLPVGRKPKIPLIKRKRTSVEQRKRQQFVTVLAFSIIFVSLAGIFGTLAFILKNAEALRGPRHPSRKVKWEKPQVKLSAGDRVREMWVKARNNHEAYRRRKNHSVWDNKRLIKDYGELIEAFPDTAYAVRARARVLLLEKENPGKPKSK